MEKLTQLTSKTTVLPIDDVDTDQIIPARFLTTTTRDGIGKALFADWRFDAQGNEIKNFPLNAPDISDCKFLVAGRNFGCGSSREHAPWSLFDFGIRAVISSEIADIFRNNSLKNGLVPVIVDNDTHQWLLANPGAEVTVDVEARELRLPTGKSVTFPIDNFARHCILEGIDQTGYLMQNIDNIGQFENNRMWQP
jgi:3-isopropylmalate/(R)-2-methylmalate dehydratase small subunit